MKKIESLEILDKIDMDIDELAYQLTAYEKWGCIDYEDGIIDLIIEDYLREADTSELVYKWNEYCQANGYYDDEYYYNDDDFFNEYFNGCEPMKIIQATYFGDYHYTDNWVQFNGYGNLDSFDDWQVKKEIFENYDFKQWVLENEEAFEELQDEENKKLIISEALKLVAKGY